MAVDLRASGEGLSLRSWLWRWRYVLGLLVGDVAALAGAWRLAVYLNQFYMPLPPQLNWGMVLGLPGIFWGFAAMMLLQFGLGQMYGAVRAGDYVQSGKLVSWLYGWGLVMIYFYDPRLAPPRSLVISAWLGSVVGIIGMRLICCWIIRWLEVARSQISVFVVSSAVRLPKLARSLDRQRHYRVVGAALSSTIGSGAIVETIVKSGAREVLVEALPQTELASRLYWRLRRAGITLRLIPSSVETLHRRGIPEIFAGMPTLRLEPPLLSGWDYRIKRLVDVLGSLFGLVFLFPLFGVIAMAIVCDSRGPIFFRQERVGLNGSGFRIWKFRTMAVNAGALQAELEARNESADGVLFKVRSDPRVTKVGAVLRRLSLDELPQLMNVLLGQMSLVGPRPLPLRDVERFADWHHVRHQVLPGMTGLWQISGRSDLDEFDDAARLDLYYIDHWSLNLDLEILVQTIGRVLFGRGAY
jgi:exopolysaccharide biosynthesis polyprenyl glycosylphosphotransferase